MWTPSAQRTVCRKALILLSATGNRSNKSSWKYCSAEIKWVKTQSCLWYMTLLSGGSPFAEGNSHEAVVLAPPLHWLIDCTAVLLAYEFRQMRIRGKGNRRILQFNDRLFTGTPRRTGRREIPLWEIKGSPRRAESLHEQISYNVIWFFCQIRLLK